MTSTASSTGSIQQPLLTSIAAGGSADATPAFHASMRASIVSAKVTACIQDRLAFLSGTGFLYLIAALYFALLAFQYEPEPDLVQRISQCSKIDGGSDPNAVCLPLQLVIGGEFCAGAIDHVLDCSSLMSSTALISLAQISAISAHRNFRCPPRFRSPSASHSVLACTMVFPSLCPGSQ